MAKIVLIILSLSLTPAWAFWDMGSTTLKTPRTDDTPRQSFFRWQWVASEGVRWWYWNYDWTEINDRRNLHFVAGISIDMIPLGTATILNRRTLITSANYLDPYMNRQRDVRIWALGRTGSHITPYRYRVWRVRRLFPRSNNPEHWHGPRGTHQPRHDVVVIHSLDQMYIAASRPTRYHYAYRAFIPNKYMTLSSHIWFAGSGYEYMEHVWENYKIFHTQSSKSHIVDCSKYLPKWWGKFICMKNVWKMVGVSNGGGLYSGTYIVGLGCFEIRYNDDRIFVFTDLRYYVGYIYVYAHIYPGEYYEYAYPQWGITLGWFYDGGTNNPYIPAWQIQDDLYPLGKK